MDIHIDQSQLPANVPVPIFSAKTIGSAHSMTSNFDVMIGLNKQLVEQLEKFSRDLADTDLQENTSDFKRFGEGSYEEWYAKGRVPFALVEKESGALAALVWFGKKPLGRKSLKHLSAEEQKNESMVESGDWHTVVFRSYAPFRGTGIMKDFVRATTDTYLHYYPAAKLWAGISRKNPASMGLAGKIGYTVDESVSDENWVAMVRA